MANANTEHSKKLRLEASRVAKQKQREHPNFRQILISDTGGVVGRFIKALDKTGEPTRVKQLEKLLDRLEQPDGINGQDNA